MNATEATETAEYTENTDLIADEQAIVDAAKAEDQAAKDAQAAADAPVVADEPAPEPQPDPVAEALAANAAEMRALREQIAAQEAARVAAEEAAAAANAPAPRDYDAELAALTKKYEDDDDFTLEELRAAERAIVRDQAKAEAAAELAALTEQQQSELAAAQEAAENARWESAKTTFFNDPGNAALIADPIKAAGFNAALSMAAQEGIADYTEMLTKAREKVTGVPAVDTAAKLREAAFNRDKDANAVAPTTLRDVPNTSNPGDNPGASLDNLDISTLEDKLAQMSDADRDRYLAGAPGGLQDNPRAA